MDTQNSPMDGSSPLLTDEEACQYLRIRQRQLYAWRMAGIIPFIRIGRSIRYRIQDLDAAIESMRVTVQATNVRSQENHSQQSNSEFGDS